MTTSDTDVTLDGRWWVIEIPDIGRLIGEAIGLLVHELVEDEVPRRDVGDLPEVVGAVASRL